jgi:HEAT repeats/Putative zinc-finger
MKCGFDKELLTALLNDQLTGEERASVDTHVAGCEDCRRELENSRRIWELMDDVPNPEPPAGTLVRFNAMLDTYKDSIAADERATGVWGKLRQLFTLQPGFAVAYSLFLIVAGLGLGHWLGGPGGTVAAGGADKQELAALTTQVSEMRELMMKSLLQNPSASERIKGISYTSEITKVDKSVIEALLTTLNDDPNVNVRLMTLEALTHYASNPAVRAGLVESIGQQESPLVQAAMADVMLNLQEKNAIKPLRKLLQQKNLNALVRDKVEAAIARLI